MCADYTFTVPEGGAIGVFSNKPSIHSQEASVKVDLCYPRVNEVCVNILDCSCEAGKLPVWAESIRDNEPCDNGYKGL